MSISKKHLTTSLIASRRRSSGQPIKIKEKLKSTPADAKLIIDEHSSQHNHIYESHHHEHRKHEHQEHDYNHEEERLDSPIPSSEHFIDHPNYNKHKSHHSISSNDGLSAKHVNNISLFIYII